MNEDNRVEDPRERDGFDVCLCARWSRVDGPEELLRLQGFYAAARRPLLAEIARMGDGIDVQVGYIRKTEANLTASRNECSTLRERAEKAEDEIANLKNRIHDMQAKIERQRKNLDTARRREQVSVPGLRVLKPVTLRAIAKEGLGQEPYHWAASAITIWLDKEWDAQKIQKAKELDALWQFLISKGFVAEDAVEEVLEGTFGLYRFSGGIAIKGPMEARGPGEAWWHFQDEFHATVTIQRHQERSEG